MAFIEEQIEAGALDGGVARCRATTRKGKPCQRTPLPEREYCPSHQHLEREPVALARNRLSASARAPGVAGLSSERVSHDTDKLIRQLSLVAFLMAERRPLTARDVKRNVEGYSEMSDEAFARRFYSDRAELIALGVPLQSQRDEFTGEELYTLRSEQYFLPPLELDRRRARGAADLPVPARGQVRVRRAAAARAPEPRARPARASQAADARRRCASR